MRSFDSWILSWLLNSLWQIPLLFAAGWLVAQALRRISPIAEHRVWVSVLLLQSLLPLCATLPWAWLPAFLHWSRNARTPSSAHVTVVMGPGTGVSTHHISAAWLTAIAIAYCIVTAYFAARFVWRCSKLSAMRREAEEVTLIGEAALFWTQSLKRFEIGNVSLASSSRIFGPVSLGFRRKLVLLPASMAGDFSGADFQTVIAHEFAHIRRNDFFKNLLYELLSLPVSYHPLFWLTRERIMESREIVCDQMAAEATGRNAYARSLLRLASLLVTGAPVRTPHAIGIFDANIFERRVMKLAEKQTGLRGMRRMMIVAACAVFGIATCGSVLALGMHVDSGSHPSNPPKSISVSAAVMAGNKISGPSPEYPEEAKKAGIEGTIVLKATINKEGTVENLVVVSGPKELQKSALDAVRQWTYKPYLLNGEPIEVQTTVNVIYSLAK